MYLDFPKLTSKEERIVIRNPDDKWGPYSFDVSKAIPEGASLSNVTATAYLDSSGSYTEKSDLIEPGTILIEDGNTSFQLKLQGEGLESGTYYLKFIITLGSGAEKALMFGPVYVESIS